MMRTFIFLMLALLNTYAEDETATEIQMEPALESVNEVALARRPDADLAKNPASGDPKEVKKAIESQRLLDKIKHGAVALNFETG